MTYIATDASFRVKKKGFWGRRENRLNAKTGAAFRWTNGQAPVLQFYMQFALGQHKIPSWTEFRTNKMPKKHENSSMCSGEEEYFC